MKREAVITGAGYAVPERVVTNADLESMVDTTDEWIVQRTGIKERRVAREDEPTSVFAIQSAQKALAAANVDPADLDIIICATVTGDMLFPSTACLVQTEIGAKRAGSFDLGAACAGFIYAANVGASMIKAEQANRVLIIGADTLTHFVDWTDRSTCVLFGDGAGAVVLEAHENTERGLKESVLLSDGSGAEHIDIQVGGSKCPALRQPDDGCRKSIYMAGREVYRFAVNAMGDACCQVLERAGLTPGDVDLFVPHQANLRIIESSVERLGLPWERVFLNIQNYGNTGGASIPIALAEAEERGQLKPGMRVLTVGFGAGLTWGANLIVW